jgi:hypothetical protein
MQHASDAAFSTNFIPWATFIGKNFEYCQVPFVLNQAALSIPTNPPPLIPLITSSISFPTLPLPLVSHRVWLTSVSPHIQMETNRLTENIFFEANKNKNSQPFYTTSYMKTMFERFFVSVTNYSCHNYI